MDRACSTIASIDGASIIIIDVKWSVNTSGIAIAGVDSASVMIVTCYRSINASTGK
jgi:hypothetical protein